jgi:phospholipid N-methyltransferase
MNTLHLFEFQDQNWIPSSLRRTLFEILDCCNTTILPYNQWVSKNILQHATHKRFKHIVELGAGTAPITKLLAQDSRTDRISLIACDLKPAHDIYQELKQHYPGKVDAIATPVDFSKPYPWEASTLLVLSATFHHIPPPQRAKVLSALTQSADGVMIFEPLRRTPLSIFLAVCTLIPALLLPILTILQPGTLRRVFWCWLCPVGTVMFVWDSVVSSIRQWTAREWREALRELLGSARLPTVKTGINSQLVTW